MKKYWEFWLDEREKSIRMSYIVIALIGVIFILSLSLYKIYTTPKPVYIISANQQTGVVIPNRYSKVVLRDFIRHYLVLTNTFTPDTVKSNFQEASSYVVPKLYATTKYDFANIINSSIQQNVSSAIFINDKNITIKKKDKNFWAVTLSATINKYFGSNLIKKHVEFSVIIKKGSPTDENPYGLYIYSLEEKEV